MKLMKNIALMAHAQKFTRLHCRTKYASTWRRQQLLTE